MDRLTTPTEAYQAKLTDIQAQMKQLQQLIDQGIHFPHNSSDRVHWGHVGDLDLIRFQLNELLTRIAD